MTALDVLRRTKPNDHGPTCVCDACHEHRTAVAVVDALVRAAEDPHLFDVFRDDLAYVAQIRFLRALARVTGDAA